jgi:hypothetical protein
LLPASHAASTRPRRISARLPDSTRLRPAGFTRPCRRRESPRRLGAAGLALLLTLAHGVAAQSVQGHLLQQGSTDPIEGALVELRQADSTVVAQATTDADGGFSLRAPEPGVYTLHAERLGFKAVDSQPVALARNGEPLRVQLYMGVKAVPLEPLVVVTDRPDPHLTAYYDRRRHYGPAGLGTGYFIEDAELEQERRHAIRASDIVRIVPGVVVRGTGGTSRQVAMQRSYGLSATGGCVPDVFVDGAMIPAGSGNDIDQLVSVSEISAIEVYPGLSKPAELHTGHLCGAIVIWTGRPVNQTRHRPYNFLILAAGLAVFLLFVGFH